MISSVKVLAWALYFCFKDFFILFNASALSGAKKIKKQKQGKIKENVGKKPTEKSEISSDLLN